VHRPLHRPLWTLLASTLVALLVVVLPGTQAKANPTPAQVEAEINKLWNEAEPLIEEYNAVHEKLTKNKAKQATLAKKIEPLQRQVDLAQLRVGVIAAQVYKGGQADAFNAVVSSGSPKILAEQLAFLQQLAHQQDEQLQSVNDLMAQYNAQKAPIDALVAEEAATDADLAAKKKDIEKRLTDLQKLRLQAYGTAGGTGSYRPWPCPAEYAPTAGYKAAKFACQQAGDPYVWAADGPGSYDCSGLTLAAWRTVGVYLPHNARSQSQSVPHVSRSNLKVGDLIFFYSPIHHVAIYVGGGKMMHAPSFGDHVRMVSLDSYSSNPVAYGHPS
jgi:cell wall-associated NlpC family hydrolase